MQRYVNGASESFLILAILEYDSLLRAYSLRYSNEFFLYKIWSA